MKPCDDRWRDDLAEHILGAPANAALAVHLAKCAACSAALSEGKARMAQIDAGIRQLAASEPSAQAPARVLAAVSPSRGPLWVLQWKRLAAALAVVVILALFADYAWRVYRQGDDAERVLSAGAAIGSWRSPTQGLLQSPRDAWLKQSPRLGESYYPLNANAQKKEKEDP